MSIVDAGVSLDFNSQPRRTSLGRSANSPPRQLPISLDDAYLHAGASCACDMQIGSQTADDMATSMIQAITDYIEGETSRTIMETEWEAVYPRFPWMNDPLEIPRPPLTSIVSIQFKDEDFATQTWDSSNYRTGISGDGPGFVMPNPNIEWPATFADIPDAVVVTFRAGYAATTETVPDRIKQACRIFFTHFWDVGRDAVITGTIVTQVPMALKYCINHLYWGDYPR